MTEADAIAAVETPVTRERIVADLRELGVAKGDTLLVHASLSAMGWVVGGPPTVVDALRTVLTEEGTLVMPTHSGQYSNPADWTNPPVPDDWIPVVRAERPPYRPEVTPTRGMGAIAECFRAYPDVVRSRHPEVSFAAWGTEAHGITTGHAFDRGLGEGSPLARLYEREADVLLLGTDHDVNTSFHLAEYSADLDVGTVSNTAPVLDADGEPTRVTYEDRPIDDSDFHELGAAFEAEIGLKRGAVGAATAKLATQPSIVDFAVGWLETNRGN